MADKSDKICGFIEAAKWQGGVAPGNKYKKSYSILDPKDKTAVIWKESEREKTKTNRFVKIQKIKDYPSPGDYDVNTSFKKT